MAWQWKSSNRAKGGKHVEREKGKSGLGKITKGIDWQTIVYSTVAVMLTPISGLHSFLLKQNEQGFVGEIARQSLFTSSKALLQQPWNYTACNNSL